MKRKWMLVLALCMALLFAFSTAAYAKKSGKKSGKSSKKFKQKSEKKDPLKGRFGLGFSLGGTSGSGGSGFSGGIGLTYYFIKYLSAHAAVGYGFTPYTWTDSNGDEETFKVNSVPADIAVHLHPIPMGKISPYFGPGVGIVYTWYEFDDEEVEETWYNAFVDGGVTYWAAKSFGINLGVRYTIPYYDDEWQTDDGQLTYGMSGSFVF